jgi:hypothetical protein
MARSSALLAALLFVGGCSHSSQSFSGDAGAPPGDAGGPSCVIGEDASFASVGCRACTEGACCDPANVCFADFACTNLWVCITACVEADASTDAAVADADPDASVPPSCEDACRASNRTGIAAYASLATCIEGRCGTTLCPY